MNHDEPLSPQLSGLAASLANLAPAGSQVNRDVLMYRAGWAAAEAELAEPKREVGPVSQLSHGGFANWVWPTTAAVFAVAACWLAVLQFSSPPPQPQIVNGPNPAPEVLVSVRPTPAPMEVDASAYIELRKKLDTLDEGLSLSDHTGGSSRESDDAGYQRLRRQLLDG